MSDIVMPPSIPCQWDKAWVGQCNKPSTNGWCTQHEGKTCSSCGQPAVRDCEHTGIQFVCGFPLCKTYQHGIIKPGEDPGLFLLGGGHVTYEVHQQQVLEWEARMRAEEKA